MLQELEETKVTDTVTPELGDIEKGDNEHVQKLARVGEGEVPAFERKTTGFSWFLVVLGTMSSMFLYALDNTIVADVVPSITASLGDSQLLPWLSVGCVLTSFSCPLREMRLC